MPRFPASLISRVGLGCRSGSVDRVLAWRHKTLESVRSSRVMNCWGASNPSTLRVWAGRSQVQGRPRLYRSQLGLCKTLTQNKNLFESFFFPGPSHDSRQDPKRRLAVSSMGGCYGKFSTLLTRVTLEDLELNRDVQEPLGLGQTGAGRWQRALVLTWQAWDESGISL